MVLETAFEISATSSVVEFWVSTRLPFEPRGTMRHARDELRKTLVGLNCPPDFRLVAEYTSGITDFVDVENVLLYNVGTGVFSHTSAQGLHVRRNYLTPPISPAGCQFQHYHRYSFEPEESPPSLTPACIFSIRGMTSGTKPHEVWWAMCSGTTASIPAIAGRFRLDIELPSRGGNIAGLVKPLLDGIICAMHPASAINQEAILRLAARTTWPEAIIKRHLEQPPLPVLEARKVLNVYREFVKWDPADELCDEFVVSPVPESESCRVWVRNMAPSGQ